MEQYLTSVVLPFKKKKMFLYLYNEKQEKKRLTGNSINKVTIW